MSTKASGYYRHSIVTRITHWVFFLAFMALISSGLQVFNAAPYLDAADRSSAAHRVLSFDSPRDGVGTTTIFGHTFNTTGFLGWAPDGMGGMAARAFPAWITIPAFQDLADGRRWHFFFAWIMVICGIAFVVNGLARREWKLSNYNRGQLVGYGVVIFVFAPLLVLSGLALSPSFDASFPIVPHLFGGRQFARLWHFVLMLLLIAFFIGHLLMVATHGVFGHLRSMITGWYRQ